MKVYYDNSVEGVYFGIEKSYGSYEVKVLLVVYVLGDIWLYLFLWYMLVN